MEVMNMNIEDVLKDIHSKKTSTSILPDQKPDIMEEIRLRSFDPAKVIFMYAAMEYRQQRQKPSIYREADIDAIIFGCNFTYRIEDDAYSTKQYQVSSVVPDFLIQKNKKYYHFEKAVIGTDVEIGPGGMKILAGTKVFNVPYPHPFVYSDGKICYGPLFDWSRDMKISFSKNYPLDNLKKLGTMLGAMLIRAQNSLEASYIGRSLTPVHNISNFKSIANSRYEAEWYAMARLIPVTRIFDNDR
jgi:hypothetical protein